MPTVAGAVADAAGSGLCSFAVGERWADGGPCLSGGGGREDGRLGNGEPEDGRLGNGEREDGRLGNGEDEDGRWHPARQTIRWWGLQRRDGIPQSARGALGYLLWA